MDPFALLLFGSGLVLVALALGYLSKERLPPPPAPPQDPPSPPSPALEPKEEDGEVARTCAELIYAPAWGRIYGVLENIGTSSRLLADSQTASGLMRLVLPDGYRYDGRPPLPSEARLIAHFGFAPPERFVPWLRDSLLSPAIAFWRPSEALARLQARHAALEAQLRREKSRQSGRRAVVLGERSFNERLARLEERLARIRRAVRARALDQGPANGDVALQIAQVEASLGFLRARRRFPDDQAFALLERIERNLDFFQGVQPNAPATSQSSGSTAA